MSSVLQTLPKSAPQRRQRRGDSSQGSISTDLPVHASPSCHSRHAGDEHPAAIDDVSAVVPDSISLTDTTVDEDVPPTPPQNPLTDTTTRDPEVARENGFQGLIPLDDIRSDYASRLESMDVDEVQGQEVDPALPSRRSSQHLTSTVESLQSMSIDDAPTRSSNPSFASIPRRLQGTSQRSPASSMISGESQQRGTSDHTDFGDAGMSARLPDDDGMRELRNKMHEIRDMALSAEEQAHRMHVLMTQEYEKIRARQPSAPKPEPDPRRSPPLSDTRPASRASVDSIAADEALLYVTAEDIEPTYNHLPSEDQQKDPNAMGDELDEPDDEPIFGCRHYMRNVKIQCVDCLKWYTCRHCHDDVEDHTLIRKSIRNMLCMHCGHAQRAAEECRECGEEAANYYCNICKLWDNDAAKSIYHCPDCGICRRGEGLGKDYVHCKKCNVCVSINHAFDHRCVERATECDCPICGEWMFSSSAAVVAMKCGHYIHRNCYDDYMKSSYKCPICSRSAVNMETQWRKMDLCIEAQPMPDSYRDTKAWVVCNDCTMRSCVPFHWLGNKCKMCDSYNTNQIRLVDGPEGEETRDEETEQVEAARAVERAQAQGILPADLRPDVLPSAAEDARLPPASAQAVPPPDQDPVAASADAQHTSIDGAHLRSRSDPLVGATTLRMSSYADMGRPSQPLPISLGSSSNLRAEIDRMTDQAERSVAPSVAATDDGESEDEFGFWGQGIRPSEFMPHMPAFPQMPTMPHIPQMPQMPQMPHMPNMPQMPTMPQMPHMPTLPTMPQGWPSTNFFSTSPPRERPTTSVEGHPVGERPSRWALNPTQWRFGSPKFFNSPANESAIADDDFAEESAHSGWQLPQWRLGSPRFLQGAPSSNDTASVPATSRSPSSPSGWPVDPRQWRLGSPTFFAKSEPAADDDLEAEQVHELRPQTSPASIWNMRPNFLGRLGSFSSAAAKSVATSKDAHDGDFDDEEPERRSDMSLSGDEDDDDDAATHRDLSDEEGDEGEDDMDLIGHP